MTIAGSGEPLLHPEAHLILDDIHALGINIGIFTNGSILTDELADSLLRNNTFIRFSINAGSPEVHSAVHGVHDYNKVLANVEKLVTLRKGKTFPTLGIQFCIASYTAKDLYHAALTAKKLGVDYFAIKAADEAVEQTLRLHNNLSAEGALEIMQKVMKLEDEKFKIYGKVEQMNKIFNRSTDRNYKKCYAMYLKTEIESDLKFYVCCNQKNKRFCYGDGKQSSFANIWAGNTLKNIYENMNTKSCPVGCVLDPLNTLITNILAGKVTIPEQCNLPDTMHPNFI